MGLALSVLILGGIALLVIFGVLMIGLRGGFSGLVIPLGRGVARVVILVGVAELFALPIVVIVWALPTDAAWSVALWLWPPSLLIMLIPHTILLGVAARIDRKALRVAVTFAGAGGWALPLLGTESWFGGFDQTMYLALHAALVTGTWEALFQLRHRPVAGFPGRLMTPGTRHPVPKASDGDPAPEELPEAGGTLTRRATGSR
jgi:hypothetical protein